MSRDWQEKEKKNQRTKSKTKQQRETQPTNNRVINEKNHLQRPKKEKKQMREHANTLFDIKNNK